jgi:polyhydroxyalkanoate synthesis regulator phasin
MTVDRGLLDRIRTRGEEVLTQVSGELMSNPRFVKAVEGAMRGREKLEEAVGQALKQMNVPTRSELKRAVSRIETLEREVGALKARAKSRPVPPRKPSPRKPKPAAE